MVLTFNGVHGKKNNNTKNNVSEFSTFSKDSIIINPMNYKEVVFLSTLEDKGIKSHKCEINFAECNVQ